MESPKFDSSASSKRKRNSGDDDGRERSGAPLVHSGNVANINYLIRPRIDKMKLIEGDNDTFGDVLGMIDEYEGKSRD